MSINAVAPLAGAWIEIVFIMVSLPVLSPSLPSRERGLKSRFPARVKTPAHVAPLAGAWIEMKIIWQQSARSTSLPSRERGLKSVRRLTCACTPQVAPLAGAWIEISPALYTSTAANVAPLAGAWIEIAALFFTAVPIPVAPLAGAWIEIPVNCSLWLTKSSLPSRERGLKSLGSPSCDGELCRSPRGSVD